jgi:hypothetical protein
VTPVGVIATVIFCILMLAWIAFVAGVCYCFYVYMRWVLPKMRKGENPFPGVTPFKGIFMYEYLGRHHHGL